MFLSIIIPIYKVEKYVHYTLESIYCQKFAENNFEVICVNDGTPDNSMDIVNRFASSHENLHVINQENQGLSGARNAGLQQAKGKYIWFVDSDDSLENNALKEVLNIIKNQDADIYGFDMKCISEADGAESIQPIVLNFKNYYLYGKCWECKRFVYKTHTAAVQRFIFKHDFLLEHQLSFYSRILHEDIEFMARAFCLAKKVYFSNKVLYRYYQRVSGSIMSSINMRSIYDRMTIIGQLQNFQKFFKDKERYYYVSTIIGSILFGIVSDKFLKGNAEHQQFINENKNKLRNIAKNVVPSLWCYFSAAKLIKLIILTISPKLFGRLF